MTIACVGITVLDRIQRVASLPTTGGKYVATDYFEVGGGPAATAAVAVAKLGHTVDFYWSCRSRQCRRNDAGRITGIWRQY